uniref:RNA-directed DNA polymerase, eukaryota n=1 Tax=Tanacetum cinerariifolium TaxID=118510 RepID=A0A6L2J6Y4_TANCI|nr:RNA-directed DNA polymerase, eukaryota [Tanacetum cinerariifolium]
MEGLVFLVCLLLTVSSSSNGFIKAIHGARGTLENSHLLSRRSSWLDIIREFKTLSSKGIDLLSFVKKVDSDKHCSVVVKVSDSSLVSSLRRAPRGGIEEDLLCLLSVSTASILLPQIEDRRVWRLESSRDFSVKSDRSFIDDSLLPKVGVPTIWVNAISIMINIFA